MEMYKLAMLILCMNMAFGWAGMLGLTATTADNYFINSTSSRLGTSDISGVLGESDSTIDFGSSGDAETFWFGAFGLFLRMLYYTTMGLPQMLSSEPFDFPDYFVLMIVTIQVVIYGIGLAAFIRGVALK